MSEEQKPAAPTPTPTTAETSAQTPAPTTAAISHDVLKKDLDAAKTVLDKKAKKTPENGAINHNQSLLWPSDAKGQADIIKKTGDHFIAMAKAHKESGRTNNLNLVVEPSQRKPAEAFQSVDLQSAGLIDVGAAAIRAAKKKPVEGPEKDKILAGVTQYVNDRLPPEDKKNISLNGKSLAAAPKTQMGATATGAEPASSEPTHPTYNWFGEEDNQETLKKAGYSFGKNEKGDPTLTSANGSAISVNKDGTYSGSTTIPLEEIGKPGTPQYDNNVKKMGQELQEIVKLHKSGPNKTESLDLTVGLDKDDQFSKDVKAYMAENLDAEDKKTMTFDGEEIKKAAPTQDKAASLTATAQTATPTPSPQPGGTSKGIEDPNMCTAYYDEHDVVSHVNVHSGPQAGWYESNARGGHPNLQPTQAGTEFAGTKPDFIDQKVKDGQLGQFEFARTLPAETSLENLSADTAFANEKRMQTTPTELTQSKPGVDVAFTHDESKPGDINVHTQVNRNAEMQQRMEIDSTDAQNNGVNLLHTSVNKQGETAINLKNNTTGGSINIHDNKEDHNTVNMSAHAPPQPQPGSSNKEIVEQQATHHATNMKGMLSMMQNLTGKGNAFSGIMSIAQGGMSGEMHQQIIGMVMQMMSQHLNDNKSSLNVNELKVQGVDNGKGKDRKVTVPPKHVPHEPSTAKKEAKAHHPNPHHTKAGKKSAHAPHGTKPKPEGSLKHHTPEEHQGGPSHGPKPKGLGGHHR